MSCNWPLVRIDELQANENSSIAIGPFGSRMKSDCYVDSGVPVIRGMNLGATPGFINDFVYVTEQKADELASCNVHLDDLVFPHRGAIGEVGIVDDDIRYILSSSLMKLTCDKNKALPKFLYYFFKSRIGKHELLKNASQVGTPGIGQPLTSLKSIELRLPPLKIQKSIAKTLSYLDDKIQLNQQINQTLEQMAQAIFKSWFVDFEPVKAKIAALEAGGSEEDANIAAMQAISGKTQAELQQLQTENPDHYQQLHTIAQHFPAAMQDSELGEIPEGWEVTDFGSVSECFDRLRIPLSKKQRESKKGDIPYYGATSVMDYVDEAIFNDIFLLLGEDGSVTKEDGTPFIQYIWGPSWVNNHAHVLQGKQGISTEHLLLFMSQQNISAYVTGAVQLKLNQRNMNSIPFIKASSELNTLFDNAITPIFSYIRKITEETKTLETVRDTLLPKLLSGELSVENLE